MSLLTEEEAKTKWCPAVRHYNAQFQPGGNSLAGYTADNQRAGVWPYNCIGSACMWWRWHRATSTAITRTEDERIVSNGTVQYRPKPPDGDGWRQVHEWTGEGDQRRLREPREVGFSTWEKPSYDDDFGFGRAHGYCGMAGKP